MLRSLWRWLFGVPSASRLVVHTIEGYILSVDKTYQASAEELATVEAQLAAMRAGRRVSVVLPAGVTLQAVPMATSHREGV